MKIWTKFGVWLPRRLCGPPSKEENCVVSIIFLLSGLRKGWREVELQTEILNGKTREHEWKRSRSNRSWANFLFKFCLQLPWTTSSPPVKGDYHVFSNTGFIRHGAVVCRIVNWKQLTAYNVASPFDIWTKFRVWLLRTLFGRPTTGENCVISIFYSIVWRGAVLGGGGGIFTVKCEYSTYYSSLFGPSYEL